MKEGPVFSDSQCILQKILLISFSLPFCELSVVGLACDMVTNYHPSCNTVGWVV